MRKTILVLLPFILALSSCGPSSNGNNSSDDEVKSYKLNYFTYGGENDPRNPSYIKEGEVISLHPASKNGYDFYSWFVNNEPVSILSYSKLRGDTDVLAAYNPKTYSINFDLVLEGATNNNRITSFTCETDNFWISDAYCSGYNFLGWIDLETNLPIEKVAKGTMRDLYLQARWEEVTYPKYNLTVKNSNEEYGSVSVTSEMFEAYEEVTLIAEPEPLYALEGWYDSKNNLLSKECEYSFLMPNNDLEISVKWIKITYKIEYDLDGGSFVGYDVENGYIPGDFIVLREAVKVGYEFTGWIDENGNKIDTIHRTTTGDLKLKATYEKYPESIELNFSSNNIRLGSYDFDSEAWYRGEDVTLLASSTTIYGGWIRFDGWYTSNGELYSDKSSILIEHDNPVNNLQARFTQLVNPEDKTNIFSYNFYPGDGTVDLLYNSYCSSSIVNDIKELIYPDTVYYDGKTYNVEGVTYVPDSVTNLEIGKNPTYISAYALSDCKNLKKLVVPDNIKCIYGRNFSYLDEIYIGKGLQFIDVSFDLKSKRNISHIEIDKGNPYLNDGDGQDCIIETETNTLIMGTLNTVIPDNITTINYFSSVSDELVIPASVKEIKNNAFSCLDIKKIIISEGITELKNNPFNQCTIGTITLPSTIEFVDGDTFWQTSVTEKFEINQNNPYYDSRNDSNCLIFTRDSKMLRAFNNIVIPEGIKSFGEYAFLSSNVKDLRIPASLIEYDNNAFKFSDCFDSIVVEDGNKVFDSRDNCNCLIKTKTNSIYLGSVSSTIPNSIESISGEAFNSVLEDYELIIPESVKQIERKAFSNCSFKSFSGGEGLEQIETEAFSNCDFNNSFFELPSSVYYINSNAFLSVENLNLYVSKSIKTLSATAFNNAKNLFIYTDALNESEFYPDKTMFSGCKNLKIAYNTTREQFNLYKITKY